jgi:hypothetical protein
LATTWLAVACLFAAVPWRAVHAAGSGDSAQPIPGAISGTPLPRVEARSATLLAVGIVRGDQMTIHVSRSLDNAPVRDATVNVMLRGVVHPTTAEADGSYTLHTKDLDLPGSAGLVFTVSFAGTHEDLKGELRVADAAAKPQDENSVRQLGWWVLNFAVCIGFLMLWSRRRKASADQE